MDRHPHPSRSTLVLVHGAWHTGHAWSQVAEHLSRNGIRAHAPTLAGFGATATAGTSLDEAVDSLVDYVEDRDLDDVVLVGWSLGGLMIALAAPRLRERLRRLVFLSPAIPDNGASIYDMVPPAMAQQFRDLTENGLIHLPFALYRDGFVPRLDETAARRAYAAQIHPQVEAMFAQNVDTADFDALVASAAIPTSYVHPDEDTLMPLGEEWGWVPRMIRRIGGAPRIVYLRGDGHEPMIVSPRATADALIRASRD